MNHQPFQPLPGGQTEFMRDSTHRYIGLQGGKGSGKSTVGAQKIAELHVINSGFKNGGFDPVPVRGLVLAPTYQMMTTVNVPQLLDAFDRIGIGAKVVIDPKRACIEIPDLGCKRNPSEILLRSADAPEKINGFEVGHVWCDEATLYDWSDDEPLRDPIVQADWRLRDDRARLQQMLLTYTPEGTGTRMYRDFEQNLTADRAFYVARTDQNPKMARYVEQMRAQYTPELAAQYLDGVTFESTAGRVFSSFTEDNTDFNLKLDPHLPLQADFDWNIAPGMHASCGQHFRNPNLLTTVHEFFEPRMDIRRCVQEIKAMTIHKKWQWKYPLQVFGDATGRAQSPAGPSCFEVLARELKAAEIPFTLLNVPSSNPPVSDRVNRANCALRTASGEIRWKIHPRCSGLIADLRGLRWGRDGKVSKADKNKGHMSDSATYRVFQEMPIEMDWKPSIGHVAAV